jgi:site-specific DNA recombinase
LVDVEDVALGHETKLRWNDRDDWVWSTDVVHEPLVDVESFERAQAHMAGHGRGKTRTRTRVRRDYVLRGLMHCGCASGGCRVSLDPPTKSLVNASRSARMPL